MPQLLREMLLLGMSLLVLFNPPSVMLAFVSLASPFPREVQNRMALRAALLYAAVMLVVTWTGSPLLMVLGVSLPALRLAGGFVLMLAAIPMVTQYHRVDEKEG